MSLDQKYKAVCFDMDGTLLNTKPRYDLMTQTIFDEYARLGVPDELMQHKGEKFDLELGREWIIENISLEAYEDIFPRTAPRILELEMDGLIGAEEFPGVRELLIELRKRGYRTGVLTRGGRAYADKALAQFDMIQYLDGVIARDDFDESEAKPNPIAMSRMAEAIGVEPEEILYMGDHKMDYQCARSSGSGFIGVTSGTHSEEDWHNIDSQILVLPTVASLIEML